MLSTAKVNLKGSLRKANVYFLIGSIVFSFSVFFNFDWLGLGAFFVVIILQIISVLFFVNGGIIINSIVKLNENDIFNKKNEEFPQNNSLLENDFSILFKSQYVYNGKWQQGFVPVIAPQRAVLVVGVQGSGKTYSILNPAIWQSIHKGYAMVLYDFKFPDMTLEAYNALITALSKNKYCYGKTQNGEPIIPKFNIIDFENLAVTSRCNPFQEKYLRGIDEAAEVSKGLLFNINKTWIKKEGDFFSDSAINYLTVCLWYLRLMERKYPEHLGEICTFPHVIELISKNMKEVVTILSRYRELDVYSVLFREALENGALEQVTGQISSVRNALARFSSENIYWVMTNSDIDLSINSLEKPQILCLGNLPQKKDIYGTTLSVYTSTIMRVMYERKERHTAFFIDELPTMYLKGLDTFITTIRSYNVATWMGIQDFEQLNRDYGKEQADVIINSVGTVFSGQVNNNSAQVISKSFGKSNQVKVNTTLLNKGDINIGYSSALQELIPASKISNLSQGEFVGKIADTFEQPIDLKLFKSHIIVPSDEMRKVVKEIPNKFKGDTETLKGKVTENFFKIKDDIDRLVSWELEDII
jgi:hypothetical protein